MVDLVGFVVVVSETVFVALFVFVAIAAVFIFCSPLFCKAAWNWARSKLRRRVCNAGETAFVGARVWCTGAVATAVIVLFVLIVAGLVVVPAVFSCPPLVLVVMTAEIVDVLLDGLLPPDLNR